MTELADAPGPGGSSGPTPPPTGAAVAGPDLAGIELAVEVAAGSGPSTGTKPTGTIDTIDTAGTAAHRAEVLVEALPYIQRFRGAVVVVKYGGNAMVDPALAQAVAEDVVLLRAVGLRPVVVHGGGPQISELMARLGKETEFRDGLRVTDAETVDIVRMVLVGKVNRDIVAAINVHGPIAVGLSGEDAGLILASAHNAELGFVGDVAAVNPAILHKLLAEDLIPVVSTIGSDADGQAYNINADTVAGALAESLQAEKAVFLTDIAGLLADVDDPDSLISHTTAGELEAMIEGGTLAGGMIPKVAAAVHALRHGVGSVHFIDGREPHVVLLELFSDAGIGTMITAEQVVQVVQVVQVEPVEQAGPAVRAMRAEPAEQAVSAVPTAAAVPIVPIESTGPGGAARSAATAIDATATDATATDATATDGPNGADGAGRTEGHS